MDVGPHRGPPALSEVLFAVLGAWRLVAQRPTATQVAGGVLAVAAIALIRWAEPPEVPVVPALAPE